MTGFLFGFTLHVTRRGDRARLGAPTKSGEHDVENCAAAPAGSTEFINGQSIVTEHDTIYCPFDADVLAKDLVTVPAGQPIDSGDYEVDGQPQRYRNPFTGWEAGTALRVVRVSGNA